MGKAAHVGVGRLLSLADLDDVQGRGCMTTRGGGSIEISFSLFRY